MVTSGPLAGLNKSDKPQQKLDRPRGVLNLPAGKRVPNHWRYLPPADLAPFVEVFWTVEWDLSEPQLAETLPHPTVHLVLEPGVAELAGPHTARFSRWLEGRSRVFGAKFRPGGFRPFVKRPLSAFSNRVLPLEEVLGPDAAGLDRRVLAHADHAGAVEVLAAFLRAFRPVPDPDAELAAAIAQRIAEDRQINKVEQLVAAFGIQPRSLQRLFDDTIGVSPKWVIQRYRLHEAAERIAATAEPAWADIAADLGYADQAHFIRDFRKLVGRTPADYHRHLRHLE
jgi:AraC-like DNA-binding protein